jgi:hypothetical protein
VKVLLAEFISKSEEIENAQPCGELVPVDKDVDEFPKTNVNGLEDGFEGDHVEVRESNE